jgi:hypothetical protein
VLLSGVEQSSVNVASQLYLSSGKQRQGNDRWPRHDNERRHRAIEPDVADPAIARKDLLDHRCDIFSVPVGGTLAKPDRRAAGALNACLA